MYRKQFVWVFFLLVSLMATGCAGPSLKPTVVVQNDLLAKTYPTSEYRLRSGDELIIKFYYQRELNEEQIIRPDGKISLQLLGDMQAAGLTPMELSKSISDQYQKFMKQCQATVIVRRTVQDRIFIGGEVHEPGPAIYSENITALQALFQSGGFLDSGELSSVMLIRQDEKGKPMVCSVDLQDPANDFALWPSDILYVPRSSIASADLFVHQYINQLIPISKNLGFSFVYDLTKTGTTQY